jgi:hypothetical protein
MRKSSVAVSLLAAGALAVGTVGLAAAQPDDAAGHGAHGSIGEDSSLSPRQESGRLPKLVGIVNDNRDIEISDRTPRAGRYKIVVRDSTRRHNWHLYGNGKSIATTVRGTGRTVFKIRLTAGHYRVVCDPHSDEMEFDLLVG